MAGIGVISNPRSRRNRRNPRLARELTYVLGERGELHEPEDLDALGLAAERFRDHEIDVLCVNGGDGTVHRAVTAMARAYGDRPLPRIALLRGGTMNTIASGLGIRGRAGEVLDDVVTRYHAGAPMPTASRWTMEVDGAEFGFLFGTGLLATFLEAYYEGHEPTPMKAAWLLARAVGSVLVRGPFARRLFQPHRCEVVVDGATWPRQRWMAVAAGTVDDIGLGFRPFFRAPRHPGRAHLVGFACRPFDVVRELPRFWRAQPTRSPDILEDVCTEVVLRADGPIGYMIDGDFHRAGHELVVRIGPRVDFVLPDA